MKAALQLEAYAHSGIDAMGIGEADLALGVGWLSEQIQQHELPYIASNLKCDGLTLPTGRVVQRGGVKLGFIAAVGPDNGADCAVQSAVPALKKAISALGEVDLLVLLSHQGPKLDDGVASALPEIDLVVNGHGRKALKPPRVLPGGTVQLSTGTRGKKLGIAQISLVPGASGFVVTGQSTQLETKISEARSRIQRTEDRVATARDEKQRERTEKRLRRLQGELSSLEADLEASKSAETAPHHTIENRLKPLNEDISDHQGVHTLVTAAKPKIDAAANVVPPPETKRSVFVGDKACLGCHAEQHAQWSTTPHSKAWATLVDVGRSGDLDCWSCHVTGAHHDDGPKHPSQVSGLENVGCESCHGPGAAHIRRPNVANIQRSPTVQTCTECHDGVKDEGRFEYATYLSKVEH